MNGTAPNLKPLSVDDDNLGTSDLVALFDRFGTCAATVSFYLEPVEGESCVTVWTLPAGTEVEIETADGFELRLVTLELLYVTDGHDGVHVTESRENALEVAADFCEVDEHGLDEDDLVEASFWNRAAASLRAGEIDWADTRPTAFWSRASRFDY